MSEEQENKSRLGKGLAYCLGLFLARAGEIERELELWEEAGWKNNAYRMWFKGDLIEYGAGEHLLGFDDYAAPEGIKDRCVKFRTRVLVLSNDIIFEVAKKEDYDWAIQEAKELLRLIDEAHGIKTIKAEYE